MQLLTHYFTVYGYAALLALALIEGPAVTVFAGMLAAHGLVDIAVVYPMVVVCDLIRDLAVYAVGRWLPHLLSWRGWRWGMRLRQQIAAVAPRVKANAAKMLVVGKLTHFAGIAVLLAAGAVRVPVFRYLFYNFVPTLPKSALLLLVGYSFAEVYLSLEGDARIIGATGFVLAAIILVLMARRMFDTGNSRGT